MVGRVRHHGRARGSWALRWVPVLLVTALLATALAADPLDLGERWFGAASPDPAEQPADVPPPAGLELAAPGSPPAVAAPAGYDAPAPERVRRTLTRGLRDPDLGRSVHAMVAGLGRGAPAYVEGGDPFLPASTTKLLTATAALAALGPHHRFETTVVARGRRLTLVGGGDPLLARRPPAPGDWPERADLVTLARRTAEALGERGGPDRRRPVRLTYDASLFTGPADNPWWRDIYVAGDIVSPISALWVDQGRDPDGYGRLDDPARAAADAFAAALAGQGVRVAGSPRPGTTPRGADELATVSSAPLARLVEHALGISDNETSEVLARHVGLAVLADGSFAGATTAVRRTLDDLGVPLAGAVIRDGSGLSRHNRLRARTLVEVLRLAASDDHPGLRPVLTGLPVGGFTGSLAYRFADSPPGGVGRVRAKTGTLTGVSALAGLAEDRSGTPLVFVLAADRVRLSNTLDARDALDDLAASLGACACS